MSHVAWTDIENLYSVRKSVHKYPELLGGKSKVSYRAKVKLHGTNGGVKVTPEGRVMAMSRSSIVSPTSDNAGFAKWVEARKEDFATLARPSGDVIVYGEWAGPGIQKGVALSQLKDKIFAVFAIRLMRGDGDELVVDPTEIDDHLRFIEEDPSKGLHVIPWFNDGEVFEIDWSLSSDELGPVIEVINDRVGLVEACDPFVKETFGVEGTGEGLVFYPFGSTHDGYKKFGDLGFKAKGEKHRVIAHTKPAQLEPSVMASLQEFAQSVCTPARLEQGVRAVHAGEYVFDVKKTGDFCKWISGDVEKECHAEVEASSLDMNAARKASVEFARKWFMKNARKV